MSVNPFPNPYTGPGVQISYQANFNQPMPGVVADAADVQDFITGVYPAGYAIFGTLMVFDPTQTGPSGGDGQGVTYATTNLNAGVAGFPVRTGAMESRRDTYPPSYAPKDMINIMRAGRIWTASEAAVTKHDPVYVRITANGALNTIGALSNVADSGNAVLVTGARWVDTAAAGAPARIEFNFIGL